MSGRRDMDASTTSVTLPSWNGDATLEPAYARLVQAIVEHRPRANYSVILHGSVLWGDRSNLRTGAPISDVDVLVVGDTLSELSAAALELKLIAEANSVSGVPLFKLSAKFRTVNEIANQLLSANEFGALMHGQVLVGKSRFEIMRPDQKWLDDQANLAVATRLVYVAEQEGEIVSSKYRPVLSRYLAARVILDIATVGLLSIGFAGRSYTYRVNAFISKCAKSVPSQSFAELTGLLAAALKTKRDPEGHECADISSAAELLIHYSRMLGLRSPGPLKSPDFWRDCRPLDLRDRKIGKQ